MYRDILEKKYIIGECYHHDKGLNIGYGVDDNYVRYMLVSCISFINNNGNINIHIVTDGISKEYIDLIRLYSERYKVAFTIYMINSLDIKLPIINNGLTIGTYFRIFFPYFLDNVERLLYLDADVICCGNISDLFYIELADNIIAAAPDVIKMQERIRDLKIRNSHYYINAGVLLINVRKWIDENIDIEIIKAIEKYGKKIRYEDQDAINIVLDGRIRYISSEYNCIDMRGDKAAKAKILHFASKPKPWDGWWQLNANYNDTTGEIYRKNEKDIFGENEVRKKSLRYFLKWVIKRIFYKTNLSDNRKQPDINFTSR